MYVIRTFPSCFFHYLLQLRWILQLLLLQQVVQHKRFKKLYEITESSKMKKESSSKPEEYNEKCVKLVFKSGIINNKKSSTQTTNFKHYLVTRHLIYKNKDTAFLEVMYTCEKWKCNKQIENSFVKAASFKTSRLNAETMKTYNTGDTLEHPGANTACKITVYYFDDEDSFLTS
jgi:hypothetical protein